MLLLAFFAEASNISTVPEKYRSGQIVKILIVPGHDDENSGAVYKTIREEDMNVAIARELYTALSDDPLLSVTLARDEVGYKPELAEYFKDEEGDILDFMNMHIEEMKESIEEGDIIVPVQVPHNTAPNDVALRLYAINKWASEQEYDAIIHIHYNDAWPRDVNLVGKYDGYTVYVPDENLPNSTVSRPLGEAISARLAENIYPSNHPDEQRLSENDGVAEDLSLIALGSNRTLTLPSVLIEYSYIFEPVLHGIQGVLTREIFAGATKNGLYEYLTSAKGVVKNFSYDWTTTLKRGVKENRDVALLQYALRELGFYPPPLFSRDDCPITGNFGPCTESAVKELQRSYKLSVDGIVGPKTRTLLNASF